VTLGDSLYERSENSVNIWKIPKLMARTTILFLSNYGALRCVCSAISYSLLAVLINLPALLIQFAYRDTHRVETLTGISKGAVDA